MAPKISIHAANVAPEFGVEESKGLVDCLEKAGLQDVSNRFLELAYASRKWRKWMVEGSKASNRDRAIIAGHYIFSTPEFREMISKARDQLCKQNIDLDSVLKHTVKSLFIDIWLTSDLQTYNEPRRYHYS